jgi:hypothetical protein
LLAQQAGESAEMPTSGSARTARIGRRATAFAIALAFGGSVGFAAGDGSRATADARSAVGGPAAITGSGFVGDDTVEGTADPSELGTVEATRYIATAGGPVTSLSIYVDASNAATGFALGLYSDAAGAPGTLLAQGSRTTAQNGTWNAVAVSATTITSGTAYWIARLATSGGSLVSRVNAAVANPDRVDTRTLAALAATFSPGASYPHLTSMYAGNASSPGVSPTPAPTLKSLPSPTPAPVATAPPTPTPTPTRIPPPNPNALVCTEMLGFSQTGNIWSLQRSPNDAFESVVDGTRYQARIVDGGAVWRWADPTFSGWSGSPISPCTANAFAPDRAIVDVTESFWIGDVCGSHPFDDCSAGADTSVARVTRDIRAVVATIRSIYPSVRQIILMPMVGGPPGGGQCLIAGHPIRAIQNAPLIAQAIAQVANGVDILATPQWGVRDCYDFYDDGQYVGHLSPFNDAKPRIGQQIGAWFAARP